MGGKHRNRGGDIASSSQPVSSDFQNRDPLMASPPSNNKSAVHGNVASRIEKRKRKKKLPVELSASSDLRVELSALSETSKRVAPIVGYFSSGYNPADSADSVDPPEVSIFRNKNHKSSRLELVVRPRESNVAFVGKSYEGEAAAHQPCHYALGILDKDTQTLKVVPIAANKIFRLEPKIPESISAEGTLGELPYEGSITEQKGRSIADLTSIYGSKRQKSIDKKFKILAQQRNDPSAREEIKGHNLHADLNVAALEDTKETVSGNIPPHDLSAVTPEKAYPLDEIILKGERDYLFDILNLLQSDNGEKATFWEENHYPRFVINRIYRLNDIQDEEEKKKHAFILSYITHLVNFWKLAATDGRAKSFNMEGDAINKYKIPLVIYQKFVRLFLDPVSNLLSTEKRELIIGYILVLAMHADSFSTNLTDIVKDLRMAVSQLRIYFHLLGFKHVRDDMSGRYSLTLPLPLKLSHYRKKKEKFKK